MTKPIPSYQVFRGDVFHLVDQAIDFVMTKLNYRIETRSESVQIPGRYEIPKEVVTEAIVNAIAHRDYTSKASVQIMLFSDRLEIINPGSLPLGWTTKRLKELHNSVPHNPLLAHPMYLAGYIERLGTGTSDIVNRSIMAGLPEPEFIQDKDFRVILYREVTGEVQKILLVLTGEMKRADIQRALRLKHDDHFRLQYILPALEHGLIEMKYPETPNHPHQRYLLTSRGKTIKERLTSK